MKFTAEFYLILMVRPSRCWWYREEVSLKTPATMLCRELWRLLSMRIRFSRFHNRHYENLKISGEFAHQRERERELTDCTLQWSSRLIIFSLIISQLNLVLFDIPFLTIINSPKEAFREVYSPISIEFYRHVQVHSPLKIDSDGHLSAEQERKEEKAQLEPPVYSPIH